VPKKSQTIKDDWKSTLLGKMIGWFVRLMGMTYRVDKQDKDDVTSKNRVEPVIFVVWHNRIFSTISIWPKVGAKLPVMALASASKDGGILASALRVIGVETARGSTSRRGAAALVMLRRALRDKKDVYITPDGPRGPKYELQMGALKLAQASGIPIVIKLVRESSCWKLKSWDRLRIPKPFSKIALTFEEKIEIPKSLSAEELEKLRCDIEQRMNSYN